MSAKANEAVIAEDQNDDLTEPAEEQDDLSQDESTPEVGEDVSEESHDEEPQPNNIVNPPKRSRNRRLQRQVNDERNARIASEQASGQRISQLESQINYLVNQGGNIPGNPPDAQIPAAPQAQGPDPMQHVAPEQENLMRMRANDFKDALEEANEDHPEVVQTIRDIEHHDNPIGAFNSDAQAQLLLAGVTPYDLHNVSQNHHDELEKLMGSPTNQQVYGFKRLLRKTKAKSQPIQQPLKRAPKPMGIVEGGSPSTKELSSKERGQLLIDQAMAFKKR